MTSVRLDRLVFSTFHEAYINYDTLEEDIVVEATPLANGATRTISATIPYNREGTRADIYATRSTIKTIVTGGGRSAASAIYNYQSTEIVRLDISYSTTDIVVTLRITNTTGGSITPNAQTITITAVLYDAPIQTI